MTARSLLVGGAAIALSLVGAIEAPERAAAGTILGSAESFAVLGASTVTNTGPTTITGDLGLSPGTSITGFPPGSVSGTIHSSDSVAIGAQADALNAYNILAGLTPATSLG